MIRALREGHINDAYEISVLTFFMKAYIVVTHLNCHQKFIKAYVVGTRFIEAIQMSTHMLS